MHPNRRRDARSSAGGLEQRRAQLEYSIAAYRRALVVEPHLGEVWWSLANLKTVTFDVADIAVMEAALGSGVSSEDAFHLHFALGKAWDDRSLAEARFRHYASGNDLRSRELAYEPDTTTPRRVHRKPWTRLPAEKRVVDIKRLGAQ